MNEALRRRSPAAGSAVRRLMMRPIQAQIASAARPRPVVEAVPSATRSEPEPETRADAADLARLRMEVMLMKAALAAERRESEALRNCLGLEEADALGAEARAERARWAALVGRLIHGLD